jgi:hypothetical protein
MAQSVIWRAYLDDSGHLEHSPVLVLAGWMAPISVWADFIPTTGDRSSIKEDCHDQGRVAVGLSGLLGLGIIAIGVRFLLAPRAAAAYGVAINEDAGAYLSAKGVRDIVSGLVVFLLIATAGHRVLGGWMLVMALIPIGDAVVVLRSGGSKAAAYGWHVATAVVMAVIGILLLAQDSGIISTG